jgi:hypothetical protein
VEQRSCLLDVRGERNKVLVDEGGELRVSVRFGFQPNASASGGRGAEVEQHRFVFRFGASERTVEIFGPFNGHQASPEVVSSQ